MSTLRVLIDRACALGDGVASWTLVDPRGDVEESGRGAARQWPRTHALIGLLAPELARVVALQLPPIPPQRRHDAARFALEDQSLDGLDSAEIAVSAQRPDGTLRVAICDASAMAAVRSATAAADRRFTRLVPLSECVRPDEGWVWVLPRETSAGFVVTDEGSAFETEPFGDPPPASLMLALGEAERAGRRPAQVVVLGASGEHERLRGWANALRLDLVDGGEWSWDRAPVPADAIDFAPGVRPEAAAAPRRGGLRAAAWIAGFALVAHLLASVVDWAGLRWRLAAEDDAQRALASSVAPELLASLTPASAVARRHREARHRAGRAAEDDLLPLLVRAAGPVQALPRGTLRGIGYSGSNLLVEIAPLPAEALARLQEELARAGTTTVAAPTASGVRLRVSLE